ncbi:MAG: hypothetical protein EXR21_03125, partial [Flavobacteriaceae bacterium]|nr:hypothetical protein [Flavobacteriaceae bacterium]
MYNFTSKIAANAEKRERSVTTWSKIASCLSLMLIMMLAYTGTKAQIASTYSTAKSYGTYTPITAAGGATTAMSGAIYYYTPTAVNVALPSAVTWNGTSYSNICLFPGGYAAFSASSSCGTYINTPLVSGAYSGVVAPCANYLYFSNNATGGAAAPAVRYQTIGQEFVIQWSDMSQYCDNAAKFSFQARINTCNGVVKFVYDSVYAISTSNCGYNNMNVGIRGSATNDYISWNNSSGSWDGATSSTSSASGCSFYSTGKFNKNLTFTFTPTGGGALALTSNPAFNTASVQSVSPNNTNAVITRVDFPVGGVTGSIILDSFVVRSNCTNNADVDGIKLFYTTGPTFSTATQLGSTASGFTSGYAAFTSLNQALSCGNNYVWVTYNIASGATVGNVVDARWDAKSIKVGSSTYPPANVSPSGSRLIANPATFSAANAYQASTGVVFKNTTNQVILQMKVDMSASGGPSDLTQIVMNTSGSGTATNNASTNIQNAKIFYTGSSSTFATTTQFGSANATPNGTFTTNGTQALGTSANYFWLTYDIKTAANTNDSVDAKWVGLTVGGSTQTITSDNPAGVRKIIPPYCNPTWANGTNGNTMGISNVTLGSINNSSAIIGGVNDYTSIATTLAKQSNNTITITTGSFGSNSTTAIFIDWNADGDFVDAGELIGYTNNATGNFNTRSYNFTVPCSATGPTRMRAVFYYNSVLVPQIPCNANGAYGESEEYTVNITDASLTYNTSFATQTASAAVLPGSNNNEVIGIAVVASGCSGTLNLTQIQLNTNGSSNSVADIDSARVYYTGNSNVFSTLTRFGAAGSLSSSTFNVNGSRNLVADTNWFWVAYNLKSGASVGNVIDGELVQATVGSIGYTPTITAPSGNRIIENLMTFTNAVAFQTNFANVFRSDIRNEMLGVNVVMSTGASVNITQMKFNLSGSTSIANDVDTVRVYYTGNSNVFATSTQFGSGSLTGATILANPFSVNGSLALAPGNNYFWLGVGIKPAATVNNVVDAQCPQITMGSPVGVQTPSVTSPTGNRIIKAAYCIPLVYNILSGVGITNVKVGSINNTTITPPSAGASTFTNYGSFYNPAYTAIMQRGSSQTVAITNGTWTGTAQFIGAWADWDQSGTFDASEFLGINSSGAGAGATVSLNFIVPCNALLGSTRIRTKMQYNGTFANTTACTAPVTYGEVEDYTLSITDNTLAWNSVSCEQNTLTAVGTNTKNNLILQIKTVMTGCTGSMVADKFTLNTNGSTDPGNDLDSIKVFWTGNSATFATTTLYGKMASQNGSYDLYPTNTINLVKDTNNFWVTYDIQSSATNGNVIDAQCTDAPVNGVSYSPTITSPTGTRTISAPQTYSSHTWSKYTNSSTQNSTRQVTTAIAITMSSGTGLNLDSMIFNTTGTTNAVNDVQNARLFYTGNSSSFATTTQMYSQTIAGPSGTMFFGGTQQLVAGVNYVWFTYDVKVAAPVGDVFTANLVRLRVGGNTYTSTPSSVTGTKTIIAPYCVPTWANGHNAGTMGLTKIVCGSINNTTGINYTAPNGWNDYTNLSTTMKKKTNQSIAITSGTFGSNTTLAAWIDWNGDGDFADAGELLGGYYNSTGNTTVTFNFTVPCSAVLGTTRMRVTMRYNATSADPCGTDSYGEGEDYTVDITDSAAAYASSTTIAASTAQVAVGANNAQVIAVTMTAIGCGGTLPVTSISLNTNGSSSASGDLTAARVFYTGNSNVFSVATQFGSTASNPNGSFTVTGSQNLVGGTNYFWVAYDVSTSATAGNVVDGECTQFVVNGNTQNPSTTAPSGSRTIQAAMTLNNVTWDQYVNNVSRNNANAIMTRVVVNMNSGAPINLDSIVASTTGHYGSLGDLSNTRCYFTGSTNNFATTTQFGGQTNSPNGTFKFVGAQPLVAGNNYFWIVYQLSATAGIGDSANAPLTKLTINGSNVSVGSATLVGKRKIIGAYCIPVSTGYCCSFGIYNVSMGSISNMASSLPASTNQSEVYHDYTAMSTNIKKLSNNTVTFQTDGAGNPMGTEIFIDWNQDGDFTDAGEDVGGVGTLAGYTNGTVTFQVPCSATLGQTRMRVLSIYYYYYNQIQGQPCANQAYLDCEDYSVNVTDSAFSYVSSTTTQANTTAVQTNTNNNNIVGLTVVGGGCGTGFNLSQINLTTTGTTNPSGDVGAAKVFYTGTTNTFATTTQYGSTATTPSGSYTVSGTQNLQGGTNYFWVAYDVNSGATIGNVVDATVPSFTLNSISQTPTVTSPSGNRSILNPMTFNSVTWARMSNNVTKGTLNCNVISVNVNMSTGASVNMDSLVAATSYSGSGSIGGSISSARCYFTGSNANFATTTLYGAQINSPSGTMKFGGTNALAVGNNYFWISYTITTSATTDDSVTANLSSIKVAGTSQSGGSATNTNMRKIIPDYCVPAWPYGNNGNTMGISNVTFNSINNSTGTTSAAVQDYTNLSTSVLKNVSYSFSMSPGSYQYYTNMRSFIDWNQDGDFGDAGENVATFEDNSGATNAGPFTSTILIPCSAVTGSTRMRVIFAYNVSITDPCNTALQYGEAEDYTVIVGDNQRQVTAINATTALNASVASGAASAEMLRLNVIASGCGSASLTQFDLSTVGNIGTNNPGTNLSAATMYYTGASSVFSTNTSYGSQSSPSGSYSITGSQSVSLDNSYYWLAYAVSSTANLYDTLDASISNVIVGGNNVTPNTGNPAGYRVIDNPMTIVSSSMSMPITSPMFKGTAHNPIVRLKVTMSSTGYPVVLDSLYLSTTGSASPTTNLQNARVWSTGSSSSFATTTVAQVGTNVTAPNGVMTYVPSTPFNMLNGDNYFWFTSGIKASANTGDSITATFDRVVVATNADIPSPGSVSSKRKILAPYCIPTVTNMCCGMGISLVKLGSINNTTGTPATNAQSEVYKEYLTLSTTLQRYSNQTISFKPGSYGSAQNMAIWIDWNQDGDFYDTGEKLGEQNNMNSTATYTKNFTVPCSALVGITRMRLLHAYSTTNLDPCNTNSYGETEDYTINVIDSAMSFVSANTYQALTSAVAQSTNNNVILSIPVVTGGCGGSLTASSFTVNTTGSTNISGDVTGASLFYSGNSNVFATATQFGSTTSNPNGSYSITGSQNLLTDTNWFWLAYNIASGSTVANVVDAQCTSLTIGSAWTPTTTNPSGNRPIQAQMTFNSLIWAQQTNAVIIGTNDNRMTLVNVKMNSGGSINLDTLQFTTDGSTAVSDLSRVKIYSTGASSAFSAAIQYGSTVTSPSGTITVAGTNGLLVGDNYFWIVYDISASATAGDSVTAPMAKITVNGTDYSANTPTTAGKCKVNPPYCTMTWIYNYTAGFGITKVSLGSIDNTTTALGGTGSIQDFTNQVTDIEKKSTNTMIVKSGSYDYNQNFAVYIDWNQNGSFQASEEVFDTYNAGAGSMRTFTFDVTPPCSAALGTTRMRVIMEYNNTANPNGYPCGGGYYNYYGEGEDYTVNVTDVALSYASSYVIQASTAAAPTGSSNNVIIGIPIITDGCGGTLPATSFSLNTTGSTNPSNDITNAKLWYTGNGNTFQAVTQFGSTASSPSGSFTITGSQNLTYDTNWFWLAYDVPSGGTNGNVLDAQCTGFTVTSNRTPSVTNPSGSRTIQAPMTFGSMSWQQKTSKVIKGTSDNDMTRIKITMSSGASVNMDSIVFATAGSQNVGTNLTSAMCYYTGASTVFATTTTFGTVQNSPNGTVLVAGTQGLLAGDNYFWITYTLPSGATFGDVLEASLTRITVNGATQTPGSATTAGTRSIMNPYCIPVSTAYCCNFGINNVSMGSISNIGSGTPNGTSQAQVYHDYTNMSTNIKRLISNTVTIQTGGAGNAMNTEIFIDWNVDGDFEDAGEDVGGVQNLQQNTNGTITFTVPCSAVLGTTRMRVLSMYTGSGSLVGNPCMSNNYVDAEDYSVNVLDSAATYSSSTTAQGLTTSVSQGVSNARVIEIKVVMIGCGGSTPATQFNLSTTGSTSAGDIDAAKIFYTGNSRTFAVSTQYGSTVSSPSGSFSINGSQNLMGDTNWFWLTYDISNTATIGNVVDAQCATMVINGSTKTPTITSPSGTRLIQNPMTFNSVTWNQMKSNIPRGNSMAVMTKVIVNMSSGATVNLDSLIADNAYTGTGGMTTDANNAKVFYTGASSIFSAATQYGSTIATLSATKMSFTGLASLLAGNNYFWITYDVPSGANINDSITATVSKVTVNGTDQSTSAASTTGKCKIISAYCIPVSTSFCCNFGIQNVSMGSISNIASSMPSGTAQAQVYHDYSGTMSTNITKLTSNTITIQTGGAGNTMNTEIFVDWNQDGDFDDAGEDVGGISALAMNTNGTVTFSVPCSAVTGPTRLRVLSIYSGMGALTNTPCVSNAYVDCEDYGVNIIDSAFVYVSSIATQALTTSIQLNTTKNNILGLTVVGGGCGTGPNLTQINFNTAGSSNASGDISYAKVYYTGTTNTFATTTQYGSTTSSPSGAFSVSGSEALVGGSNYFWLAYDVPSGATLGNVVDATCPDFVLSSGTQTPSVTAPSGNRLLQNPMTFNSVTWTPTPNNVIIGTNYADVMLVNVIMNSGASINLDSLVANTSGSQNITTNASVARCYFTGTSTTFTTTTQFGGDLYNPNGNMIFKGTVALQVGNNYFYVAYDVYGAGAANVGDSITATLTRIYTDGATQNAGAGISYGKRRIIPPYCTPAWPNGNNGNTMGITNVTFGSINNTTACTSPAVQNYTNLSTTVLKNVSYPFSMKHGSYQYYTNLTAYIDWNQDGDFDDAGEAVASFSDNSGTVNTGPFNFNILVPCSAATGPTRMRVIFAYNAAISPCSTSLSYGEAEDYTVIVGDNQLAITSVVTTTASTVFVSPSSTNNQMLMVRVNKSGCGSATFTSTQFDFNTNGTTTASDITAAKVFFTGNSKTFATTTTFGTTNTPSGAFSVTGSQVLTSDSSFFWLAYNIASSATVGNALDAEGTVMTMNSTTYGSSSAPSGNRLIAATAAITALTTDQVTGAIQRGANKQAILRVKITGNGQGTSPNMTEMDFNIGSTNTSNIGNVRIYYTGTSSTFATTTQYGSTYSYPIYGFTIYGSAAIGAGDNYFWLTYDVPSNATVGDCLDAEFELATLDSGGTTITKTPIVGNPSGCRSIMNAYCSPNWISNLGAPIGMTKVVLKSINNTTTAPNGQSGTIDYTTQSTTLARSSVTNMQIITGSYNYYNLTSVHIDFNQDGAFAASERVYNNWIGATGSGSASTLNFTVTVPCGATLGATRMRVVNEYYTTNAGPGSACGLQVNYGEAEDYSVVIGDSAMNVQSVNASQAVTTDVFANSNNNQIAGIIVSVSGCTGALTLTDLSLNTNGSTNASSDISNAKVFYTETVNTFTTTTTFGSTGTPNGAFTVTGSQALVTGANYFWAAYDLGSATTANVIDIEVNTATISATTYNSTTTAPSGSRTVNVPMSYVSSAVSSVTCGTAVGGTYAQVAKLTVTMSASGAPVNLTQLNLNTNGTTGTIANNVDSVKVYFTGNTNTFATTTLFGTKVGPNGTFTVTGSQALSTGANYVWITYRIKNAATAGDSVTVNATQIIVAGSSQTPSPTSPGCKRKIIPAYCIGTYSNDYSTQMYMSRVKKNTGSFDHTSSNQTFTNSYTYYTTPVCTLTMGKVDTLQVLGGTTYNISVGVFADVNQDGDFDDAGEKMGENQNVNYASLTPVVITVPSTGVIAGTTRLRVRNTYQANAVSACGTLTYAGETQDYDVVLMPPPAPTPTITPSTSTFCVGIGQTFTTGTAVSTHNYVWKEGSTVKSSGTGSPYNQFSYNPSYTGTFNITCTVTDAYSQTGVSNTATVTVNPNATAGIASAWSTSLCSGQEDTMYVAGFNGTIQWQIKIGTNAWSDLSGATNDTMPFTPSVTAMYRAKVSYGSCNPAFTNIVTVSIGATNVWMGKVNNDWNNGLNWCNGTVPIATSIVTISGSANQPVIISAASCSTLTVNAGAVLTLNNGANLTVNGAYVKNSTGTLLHNGGQLNLSKAQNIPGQAYHYLKLSGPGSYRFTGNTSIANYLVIPNATTFVSDSGYTITCPGDVTNNGTIQSNGSG